MIIASITISSDRASIIGDALRSVEDFVDLAVIVDLGITDNTLEIAREIVGDKLRVVKWEGEVNSKTFASIRNFGMDEAFALGANWALTLDTDERMNFGDEDIRVALEAMEANEVLAPNDEGTYLKERFLRLPRTSQGFVGKVHECVIPTAPRAIMQTICFSELPKSPDQMEAKLHYLIEELTAETLADPTNPRNFYYLGDAFAGLERKEEAIKAFDKCASLRGWNEESAWACFRMANLLAEVGRRQDARDICAVGLARHAGMPELAWLAGECSLLLNQPDQAVYWARMAVANGCNNGETHYVHPRIGFRYPPATTWKPYDLLHRAYKALGKDVEADKCAVIADALQKDKK